MHTLNDIELYLNDIKNYANSALIYLTSSNNKQIDKDEIVMYLSCCDEIIEDKSLISTSVQIMIF